MQYVYVESMYVIVPQHVCQWNRNIQCDRLAENRPYVYINIKICMDNHTNSTNLLFPP